MAAAGFDGHATESAVAMGQLALVAIDAIKRQPPLAGRKLTMRIGIHCGEATAGIIGADRKSTRLNSSHSQISYAAFCLKKQKTGFRYSDDSQSRFRNGRMRISARAGVLRFGCEENRAGFVARRRRSREDHRECLPCCEY